jgi:hypothetical protein
MRELIWIASLVLIDHCEGVSDKLIGAIVALACAHSGQCRGVHSLFNNPAARSVLIVRAVVRLGHAFIFPHNRIYAKWKTLNRFVAFPLHEYSF